MNLTIEHAKVSALIVATLLFIWWVVSTSRNDSACKELDRCMDRYRYWARFYLSCTLEQVPGHEPRWIIQSPTIRYIAYSREMLQLLTAARRGTITRSRVEKMSIWPSESL